MGIKRGDIYYIENGHSVGSEQRSGRPAVVVSNDKNNEHSSTLEVVYLTSQSKRPLPTHVDICSAPRRSIALCEQITSVAVERFGDYCGHVTEQELRLMETAMMVSLGFGPSAESESSPAQDYGSVQIAVAEARCAVLQEMYDALLDRLINAN